MHWNITEIFGSGFTCTFQTACVDYTLHTMSTVSLQTVTDGTALWFANAFHKPSL